MVADFAMEKASNVMNDENIADFVINATKKQESINEELKKKDSPYRLGEMELELSIPPSISFSIRRLEKETISKKTDVQRTDQPDWPPYTPKTEGGGCWCERCIQYTIYF